jgi:hypothetical protein
MATKVDHGTEVEMACQDLQVQDPSVGSCGADGCDRRRGRAAQQQAAGEHQHVLEREEDRNTWAVLIVRQALWKGKKSGRLIRLSTEAGKVQLVMNRLQSDDITRYKTRGRL